MNTIPVISLYNPWAAWVVIGWKTIETRRHDRFRSLVGRRIAIHAAKRFDRYAPVKEASPYLTLLQRLHSHEYAGSQARVFKARGAVIGTVNVIALRELSVEDSENALCNCDEKGLFGLELSEPQLVEPLRCTGRQGIWHIDWDHIVPIGTQLSPSEGPTCVCGHVDFHHDARTQRCLDCRDCDGWLRRGRRP